MKCVTIDTHSDQKAIAWWSETNSFFFFHVNCCVHRMFYGLICFDGVYIKWMLFSSLHTNIYVHSVCNMCSTQTFHAWWKFPPQLERVKNQSQKQTNKWTNEHPYEMPCLTECLENSSIMVSAEFYFSILFGWKLLSSSILCLCAITSIHTRYAILSAKI